MTSPGRRAFVTGAASGIGRGLAERLRRDGWSVVGADVEAGEGVVSLDVTDAEAWERVLDEAAAEMGGLDVVCNVAGVLVPGPLRDRDASDIDLHVDVNAKGVMYGTLAAVRRMRGDGGGHVVNVCSLAGLSPVPGLALYAASKWAVRGFTLSAALELADDGVALTCVYPDAVRTPMLDIQVDVPEAALTFSAKSLTVDEIVDAIVNDALVTRPLELSVPRHRGATAKFAGLFPGAARLMAPVLTRVGRRTQERLRARRP